MLNYKNQTEKEKLTALFGSSSEKSGEVIIEHPTDLDAPKESAFLRGLYRASAALFLVVLVFGFISLVDKDKTVSQAENRALAAKPKFSLASLMDGKFAVEYENYYSDNFPARDFLIKANRKINEFFTRFSTGDDGDVIVSIDRKDEDFVGEGIDLGNSQQPDKEEKEKITVPVTPDDEVAVKGSIIVSSNRAMEIFTYSEKAAKNYTSILNNVANAMPQGVNFYSMIVPTSVEFYGTKTYREGSHSQYDAIENVYNMLNDSIIKIDAYSSIASKANEYIYFRTDHHWTARGAYYAYDAFCKAKGFTPPALSDFNVHYIENFIGSLYRSTQMSSLEKNPDYVECFELIVQAENIVYSFESMKDGVESYVIAKDVKGSNKYLAFVAGDQPLEKISTSVKNGKKILVLKESYGNAFIPFLCNNYEEVYVVDPRKINMNLPEFVANNKIEDVLAMNYCFSFSNKTYCSALNALIK